jgi:serine/threonine protein kinase
MQSPDPEAELAEFIGRVQDLLNEGRSAEARAIADERPEFADEVDFLFEGDGLLDQLLSPTGDSPEDSVGPEPRLDLKRFSIAERRTDVGLGSVYSLRMPKDEAPRELVVVRSWFTPTQRERILNVARVVRGIRIPNILPVLETGRLNQVPFVVRGAASDLSLEVLSELLLAGGGADSVQDVMKADSAQRSKENDRVDAATQLAANRNHVAAIVSLGAGIAMTLGRLHAAGFAHLELTPNQITLEASGDPKIQGVGMVWFRSGIDLERMRGFEPNYLPPEMFAPIGRPTTWKADIYSLGCILVRLLGLKRPHVAKTNRKVRASLLGGMSAVLRELPAGLPRSLLECIGKATDFDPEKRYSTMEAFADALLKSMKLRASSDWLQPSSRRLWDRFSGRS